MYYHLIKEKRNGFYSTLLLLLILLYSCEKENPRQLCGVWAIDKMNVNGKSFEKFLNVNTISFKCKDNSAFIHGSIYYEGDNKAKWKVIETDGKNNLKIESSIKIYNDNFDIRIDKEPNGQLHLYLKSPKIEISALKIIEDN